MLKDTVESNSGETEPKLFIMESSSFKEKPKLRKLYPAYIFPPLNPDLILLEAKTTYFSITFDFFMGRHQFTLELSQCPRQKRAPIRTPGPVFSTQWAWAAAGAADSQRGASTCCVGRGLLSALGSWLSSRGISYSSPPRVLSADGRRAAEQRSGGDGEQEPSRSAALPRKSLAGCGERGPRWAADRGAATGRPQGAVRVQAAMAEDRFPSRPSCEGFTSVSGSFQGPKSHQTWNDWTPANWDCQEDIFSKFPCQIAGKGGYDMPRRIHIYICIHRYKFQIQKSWTLSFWKGCGLHTRTSPTHYPGKGNEMVSPFLSHYDSPINLSENSKWLQHPRHPTHTKVWIICSMWGNEIVYRSRRESITGKSCNIKH